MEYFKQWPDLSKAPVIALDLETRDPSLKAKGCGGVRNEGEILGFSLAWRDLDQSRFGLDAGMQSLYFPIAHAEGNLDRYQVTQYLNKTLGHGMQVVGANIAYDLEWCRRAGVQVPGPKTDVQITEALIDENQKSYRLNVLSNKYLGESKLSEELFDLGSGYLGCPKEDVITRLKELPAELVEGYAREDAELTLRIMEKQAPLLSDLGLGRVAELESKLIDVLQDVRWQGIRLDTDQTRALQIDLRQEEVEVVQAIERLTGTAVNPWSHDEVQAAATKLGLTGLIVDDKGKQSFPAPWLVKQEHPFFKHLLKLRQLSKAGGAFLTSFLDFQNEGRIHCVYHQARGDRGGTRSGRLSASNPNLQQIPARNEDLAPRIRSLFLPEKGCRLVAFDHSQIEPRITVHYSTVMDLAGADEATERYQAGDVDYHQMVADMTGLPRYAAKQMNLGLAYGMGAAKMADMLGMTREEAEPLFKAYHDGVPFVKKLGQKCSGVAERRKYVRTIIGRRRNFNLYGSARWKAGMIPKHYDDAVVEWGPAVKQYFTHKAMNSVIQGTAADILKQNMVDLYEAGFTPHLSIHDELVFSVQYDRDDPIREIKHIMEHPTGIELKVPLRADIKVGDNWGQMKKWPV